MKTTCFTLLLATSLLIAGCGSHANVSSYVRAGYDFSEHDRIAIVDVVGEIKGESAKNQVADEFSLQLLRKGFAPIQREYVMRLLSDAGFEKGDLSPDAYAVEAGRILQVPAVLIITVPNFGTETSLAAKILEVTDGSALWLGNGTVGRSDDWATVGRDPFAKTGGSLFDSTTIGAETFEQPAQAKAETEPLALTPAELKPFKEIAREICKSLPYRSQNLTPKKKKMGFF